MAGWKTLFRAAGRCGIVVFLAWVGMVAWIATKYRGVCGGFIFFSGSPKPCSITAYIRGELFFAAFESLEMVPAVMAVSVLWVYFGWRYDRSRASPPGTAVRSR